MFKIIALITFLILIYVMLKREKKSIKYPFFLYFLLLSILFMGGLLYIITTYQLNDDPIDGGFQKQFDWVSIFVYFYMIPLFIMAVWLSIRKTRQSLEKIWTKIVVSTVWIIILAGIGYVSQFIFILIFYGFAP